MNKLLLGNIVFFTLVLLGPCAVVAADHYVLPQRSAPSMASLHVLLAQGVHPGADGQADSGRAAASRRY